MDRLQILHLSDMHMHEQNLPDIDAVVGAIRGVRKGPPDVLIVVSGDVAFSGAVAQYDAALGYLRQLRTAIEEEIDRPCPILVCPGNHDCDFSGDTEIRDMVVERIRSEREFNGRSPMLAQCIGVQTNFFEFLSEFDPPPLAGVERLAWTKTINGGKGPLDVGIRLLNTAWMSTIHENQGHLIFPTELIPEMPDAGLRITVMHHPLNWFQAENARDLRRLLQASSAVILTGQPTLTTTDRL